MSNTGVLGTISAMTLLTVFNGNEYLEISQLGSDGNYHTFKIKMNDLRGNSAYQVALANGFVGTETQWLASLVGPQGLSAYEVAVANGYTGDVSSWLLSLVGPQGPVGAAGAIGPQGPAGADGAPGPQGPAGPQGNDGPAGPQGNSIKIITTLDTEQNLPTADQLIGDSYWIGGSLYSWNGATWTNSGSLKGEPGADGPQGTQGIQGLTGPQGPAGAAFTIAGHVTNIDNLPSSAEPNEGWIVNKNLFVYVVGTGWTDRGQFQGTDGSSIVIKGTVNQISELPNTAVAGDSYWINGTLYTWDTSQWINSGSLIGPQGPAGADGAIGPQGPAGADGATGPQGPAGYSIVVKGTLAAIDNLPIDANVGEAYWINTKLYVWNGTSWQESTDLQGPQGIQGVAGPQGEMGPQGPAGADGATGPQGPAGADGAAGPQGPAGADGAPGPMGNSITVKGTLTAVGDLPASGTIADAYWIGSVLYTWNGVSWLPSNDLRGPQGIQGPIGATGANGLSAYQVAVNNGYSGTEADWAKDAAPQNIRTPVAIYPLTNSSDFQLNGTLQASAYAPLYSVDTRNYREFQLDLATGDFSAPIRSASVNSDTYQITSLLTNQTNYKWRCRDVSVTGKTSDWSVVQTFTTVNVYIATPTITSPTAGGNFDNSSQSFTSSAFTAVNYSDTHAASYWEVRDANNNVVLSTGRDTVNLTSYTPAFGLFNTSASYTVLVKYEGTSGLVSNWSTGVTFIVINGSYGKYLSLGTSNATNLTLYGQDVDTLKTVTNPTTLPGGTVNEISYSSDGVYMAVASATTPFIQFYKRSINTYTKLANPATLPGGLCRSVALSSDATYAVVGCDVSPYLYVYKRSGDTFTLISGLSQNPTSATYACSFSSDDVYLAVGTQGSGACTIYKRSGDAFTYLTQVGSNADGTRANGVGWSKDTNYLALANANAATLQIYKRTNDTFSRITIGISLPGASGNGAVTVAFSPDGKTIALGHSSSSPNLYLYKFEADVLSLLSSPATLPTGAVNKVAYSSDGGYLAVGMTTSPYIYLYKIASGTYTKLANPTTLPPASVTGLGYYTKL